MSRRVDSRLQLEKIQRLQAGVDPAVRVGVKGARAASGTSGCIARQIAPGAAGNGKAWVPCRIRSVPEHLSRNMTGEFALH